MLQFNTRCILEASVRGMLKGEIPKRVSACSRQYDSVFYEWGFIYYEKLSRDRLRSDKDRKDIRDELDGTRQTIQELFAGDWIQIRRKKLKDPIIRSFILDIKEKYNLTLLETENVYKIIRLGFMFNWIPNNAVVYEDQKILDITSLHFNPKTREFELEEKSQKYKRTYKPKKVKLSSLWAKYIARSTSQQYGYTFIF